MQVIMNTAMRNISHLCPEDDDVLMLCDDDQADQYQEEDDNLSQLPLVPSSGDNMVDITPPDVTPPTPVSIPETTTGAQNEAEPVRKVTTETFLGWFKNKKTVSTQEFNAKKEDLQIPTQKSRWPLMGVLKNNREVSRNLCKSKKKTTFLEKELSLPTDVTDREEEHEDEEVSQEAQDADAQPVVVQFARGKRKRTPKGWDELGPRQKLRRTVSLKEFVATVAQSNGIDNIQLLSYLMYCETYNTDKPMAALFHQIEREKKVKTDGQMDLDHTANLFYRSYIF